MAAPKDAEVTAVARELARLGEGGSSDVYRMSWWNEHLMEWAMARPEFKAQLFRFVDVFPATTSRSDVLDHVRQYLDNESTPSLLRKAIGVASAVPLGARVTASQANRNIARMADQFILGTTDAEAVASAAKLWELGRGTIVDLLGEKTVTEAEADAYAARLQGLLAALSDAAPQWEAQPRLDADDRGPLARVQLSVKMTALASKYKALTRAVGLGQAKERLRPLLRSAQAGNALVWFDMEHYEYKDLTLTLFKELLDEPEFAGHTAGLVIQSYLKDSFTDLAELIDWSGRRRAPVWVRLVKGAQWDTEVMTAQAQGWSVPVYERKVETDANYERCARLMLEHQRSVRSAFASHNLRSLAYAVACARASGVPENGYEIQMLHGMAEPMHDAVRRAGLRLRVYAPVGELVPGMAYLVRRLLENTSNDSFVRLRFAEGRQLDELLAPPDVEHLPPPVAPQVAPSVPTVAAAPTTYEPEPLAEWHRPRSRGAMVKAVERSSLAGAAPYVAAVVDGRPVRTTNSIESVDPAAPAQVIGRSASCEPEHVESAVSGAVAAQREWARVPVIGRATVLFRAADWMRRRRFDLAALEVREAAKPWGDADADVCEAIDFLEYYGREMLRLDAGGTVQSPPGEANRLHYEPRGVGAVIAPWNFPLAIPTGMVAAALVTGNAVVFKPAEQTPATAAKLVEAFDASGLPPGILQFLPGVGETIGPPLVQHRDIAFVAFTGSRPVGLEIVEQAARHQPGQRHIKKVIVELGGKNALIVDSDADLDAAVPAIVQSAFGYSGQKCSALSRLIVHERVRDHLLERVVGAVASLRIGAPIEMGTEIGPVIDADAHERIRGVIDGAFMWGEVLVSRTDLPDDGFFVAPTVVTEVKENSPLAKEEIFGPVLATFAAADLDHALAIANDTDYALTGGIFSRSPRNIARFSDEIRAGNVYVNRTITGATVGRQPFGGFGLSGTGTKAGGPDYLLHFCEPRTVTENTVRQGFSELR